jgi:hypothetical protein
MDEELLAGLFLGMFFSLPFGWFLRSAVQWRRDARRAAPLPPPAPPPAILPPGISPERVETLLERIGQRMESLEDRVEFTERLMDERSRRTSVFESSVAARDPASAQ